MKRVRISSILSLVFVIILCVTLTACGKTQDTAADANTSAISNTETLQSDESELKADTDVNTPETPGEGASSVSNIASTSDVPLITLGNGVRVPQLGLEHRFSAWSRTEAKADESF